MAKKILEDGTIAYVGTICIFTDTDTYNVLDQGLCKILRTAGRCENENAIFRNLNAFPWILCEFAKTRRKWFVNPDFVRRATKEEKKQWPR